MSLGLPPGREQAGSYSAGDDKLQLALGELTSYRGENPALDIPPNAHTALNCPLKAAQLSTLTGRLHIHVCCWKESHMSQLPHMRLLHL